MYIRIAFSIELRLRVSRSLRSLANYIIMYLSHCIKREIKIQGRNDGRKKEGKDIKETEKRE